MTNPATTSKKLHGITLTNIQWMQLQRSLHNDWLDNSPTNQRVIERILAKLGATPVTEVL